MKFLTWYTPKFRTEIESLIPKLKASLKAGEVNKAELRRFKSLLNKTNLKKHLPKSYSNSWSELNSFMSNDYGIYLRPVRTMKEAEKFLKKERNAENQATLKFMIEACKAFTEPCALIDALELLKEETSPRYLAKRASNETCQRFHDLIDKIIADTHRQLIVEWKEVIMRLVTNFEKREDQKESLYSFYSQNPWASSIVSSLVQRENGYGNAPYVRVKEFDKRFMDAVKKEVDRIEQEFKFKNIKKVTPLIEARKDFVSAELLKVSVRSGLLEGVIKVQFQEVKFDVQSQIVWSTSIYGKSFTRYPTTFHNVKLPTGHTIKMASEKYMNEELPK